MTTLNRNAHILKSGEVILAYTLTWFLCQVKQPACGLSNALITKEKGTLTRSKECLCLKMKIKMKCLPPSSFDDKPSFPGAEALLTHCAPADFFFFLIVSLTCFWLEIKLCWKPCFSGAISQSRLGIRLVDSSSVWFNLSKAIFCSCYCLLIDHFHWRKMHRLGWISQGSFS